MTRTVITVAMLGVLLWAGAAWATDSSVTYSTTTPIPYTLTDWSALLAFPQFNPSLGTLQKVAVDIWGDLNSQITVQNIDDGTSSGTAFTEVQETFAVPGITGTNPNFTMDTGVFAYSSLGANQQVTSGSLAADGEVYKTYTSSTVLSAFTGTGSVSAGVDLHADVARLQRRQ